MRISLLFLARAAAKYVIPAGLQPAFSVHHFYAALNVGVEVHVGGKVFFQDIQDHHPSFCWSYDEGRS